MSPPLSDQTPEQLIREAIDLVAMGYPIDGTEAEKTAWMDDLRTVFESRARDVRDAYAAASLATLRDDD